MILVLASESLKLRILRELDSPLFGVLTSEARQELQEKHQYLLGSCEGCSIVLHSGPWRWRQAALESDEPSVGQKPVSGASESSGCLRLPHLISSPEGSCSSRKAGHPFPRTFFYRIRRLAILESCDRCIELLHQSHETLHVQLLDSGQEM